MKKENRIKIIWLAAIALYAGFIFLFSYLYPMGSDEYAIPRPGLFDFFYTYLNVVARIGVLVTVFVRYTGDWLFKFLNPVVQTAFVFLVFNVVFLRGPDFKTLRDLPAFFLICFLSVFAVAQPDNTLFWVGGACNYSWLMAAFLFFLLILRRQFAGNPIFKDSSAMRVLMFFFGIFIGMTNENLAPMAPVILILFAALCVYNKKKLPQWFWWLLAGVTIGLVLLFASPAYEKRAKLMPRMAYFYAEPLLTKASRHLHYINRLIAHNLFIPPLTLFALLLAGYDNFRKIFKQQDFLLSLFFLAAWFVTAFALCLSPIQPLRIYYAPAVFNILSFLFMLKYITERYKINFLKGAAYAAVLLLSYLLIPFAHPYFLLHKQQQARIMQIETAIKEGKAPVYITGFWVLSGPAENLTIIYYDGGVRFANPPLAQYYKYDIRPGWRFEEAENNISEAPVRN